ncbi:MAG: hypothetical protein K0S08_189 [Gammaproteobacteria bacterium]|nr:hypothetical protein [Gammaproteobacteria bacterium]
MQQFQRTRLLKIVYSIIAVGVIYFFSSFFMGFSIHGEVSSNIYNVVTGVGGYIQKVYVQDNQFVHKGDLLLEIDPTPYKLKVEATNAAVDQAQVQLQIAETNAKKIAWTLEGANETARQTTRQMDRFQRLERKDFFSKENFDEVQLKQQLAKNSFEATQLQLGAALHSVDLSKKVLQEKIADNQAAQYQLSLTKIYAPEDGYTSHLLIYAGEYVEPQQSLFGLIGASSWYVTGFYFQNELRHMRPGQRVLLNFASDPWHIYAGRIESVGRGVALEPSNSSALPYREPVMGWLTNDYYFPVRIKIDKPHEAYLSANSEVRTLIIY